MFRVKSISRENTHVVRSEFMENVFVSYEYPNADMGNGNNLWDMMVEEDSFEYVVVSNNQQFGNFHRFMIYQDTAFELVHADGVSSLYLSRNERNNKLIEELAYNKGERDVFQDFTAVEMKKP